jgi:hypothetical protein
VALIKSWKSLLHELKESNRHMKNNTLNSTMQWLRLLAPEHSRKSLTYAHVSSMLVIFFHCLFFCSDSPHPVIIFQTVSGYFSNQNFFPYKCPNFSTLLNLHTYSPLEMEQTECSDVLEFKLQTPGNHPAESIQHSENGERLKSSIT